MTLTIDISPDTEARLQEEAVRRGQTPDDLLRLALDLLLSERATAEDGTETLFRDMRAMSLPTLQEYWDNDQDAIYDSL